MAITRAEFADLLSVPMYWTWVSSGYLGQRAVDAMAETCAFARRTRLEEQYVDWWHRMNPAQQWGIPNG